MVHICNIYGQLLSSIVAASMPSIAFSHSVSPPQFNYSSLVNETRPWWKIRRLVVLNVWISILLITSSTNGFDASMINGLQSVDEWKQYFDYPSGSRLGLIASIQSIGGLCAYPFAPYIADGMGRKKTIILGAFLMVIGAMFQTASWSFSAFIGARFLIGFGLTFAVISAPLLILEISYPTHRGPLTSSYNTFWFAGSIIAAWTTYGSSHISSSWSWRIPSALQALPSVIQLLTVWWVPESPRYLVSRGFRAEALRTLAYYHSNGDEEDPLVEYQYEEIKAALLMEKIIEAQVGWRSLFMTAGNRRRMRVIIAIAFFSQWSGNGLLSYYLAQVLNFIGITDSKNQLFINGVLNIFNFGCATIAGLLCDRLGRRMLFISSTSLMLLFWTMLTLSIALYSRFNDHAAAIASVVLIFCYTSGYAIAYTPLIVSYTLEILPFSLRARGFAVFNFTVSLSIIINQYINPILLEKIGWKYYIVYACWLMFELVFVYWFIVETKGRTLEETAALFDGTEAVQDITYRAAIHAGLDLDTRPSPSALPRESRDSQLKRYQFTPPSPPFTEKRKGSGSTRKLPDNMTYILEVQRPDEIHSVH